MIVFRPAFSSKMGSNFLKPKMATVLLWSVQEQSHNSDERDTDSKKVRKAKKSRKLAKENWSGNLICKLRDEAKALLRLVEDLLIRH